MTWIYHALQVEISVLETADLAAWLEYSRWVESLLLCWLNASSAVFDRIHCTIQTDGKATDYMSLVISSDYVTRVLFGG
jgi:hypothetical protein